MAKKDVPTWTVESSAGSRRWRAKFKPLQSYWEKDEKGMCANTLMLDISRVYVLHGSEKQSAREAFEAAVIRLARRPDFLSTRFGNPKARAAIRRMKRDVGPGYRRELRQVIFPEAILLTVADCSSPQPIRLGGGGRDARSRARAYVRDADLGSVLPVPPDHLPGPAFRVWFKQRAMRHVPCTRPGPRRRSDAR